MTKIRETAAQRREREATEAEAARQDWERRKPAMLLRALACATDMGVHADVFHKSEALCYSFTFENGWGDVCKGEVSGLEEWELESIMQRLCEIREAKAKQERMRSLRDELISRMTPEEREALGLI